MGDQTTEQNESADAAPAAGEIGDEQNEDSGDTKFPEPSTETEDAAEAEGQENAPESAPEPSPKARRAELAKDREVQRLMKQAADRAVRDALKAEAAKQQKEAERAKMEATERLEAEKADMAAELETAKTQASDAEFQLTFYRALMGTQKQLVDPNAVEYVKLQVARSIEADDTLDMAQAVEHVLAANAYLVRDATGPATRPKPATSQPPQTKTTEQPASEEPKKAVDVSKMTPQEFKKHLATTHGITH